MLFACTPQSEPVDEVVPAPAVFDEALLREALIVRLDPQAYEGDLCHQPFRYYDTLSYYYRCTGFPILWKKALFSEKDRAGMIDRLATSYLHGLDTNWYHLPLLRLLDDSLAQMNRRPDTIDYHLLAEMEYLLSESMLAFSVHLQRGAFDPRLIFPEDYLLPSHELDSSSYFGILGSSKPLSYLDGVEPRSERYVRLQQALATYRAFAAAGGWEEVPFDYERRPKINPGDTTYILPQVAARLKATGLLDTAYYPDSSSIYDTVLASALERFQEVHGILPDGVIGTRTIREMNMSAAERVRLLEVNLERLRWMRYPEKGKYVMVNIPDFRFFSFRDGEPVDTMKVCVGKPKPADYDKRLARFIETGKNRPPNMETPCMHSKYSYVVLNPRWHIPRSIAENEIFWSVLKDTAYLQEEHIRVYLDGQLMDPDSIDWASYKGKKLPFHFKQDPGTFNSLGIIKFIFWNKFSIFMHDTPAKSAFRMSNRAVSHGCMRLEQPLELAAFLLEEEENWPMDRVRINLGLPPQEKEDTALARRYREIMEERELLIGEKQALPSTRIHLQEEVQLFVDYFTSWVDGDGILQFRPDVYRKDHVVSGWFDSYRYGTWPTKAEEPKEMALKGI